MYACRRPSYAYARSPVGIRELACCFVSSVVGIFDCWYSVGSTRGGNCGMVAESFEGDPLWIISMRGCAGLKAGWGKVVWGVGGHFFICDVLWFGSFSLQLLCFLAR